MILAFLITTLILFLANLFLNVAIISLGYRQGVTPIVAIINTALTLVLMTWNIFIIISL